MSKHKKCTEIYSCDVCSLAVEERAESNIPENWAHLAGRVSKNSGCGTTSAQIDVHFCSTQCLAKFFENNEWRR